MQFIFEIGDGISCIVDADSLAEAREKYSHLEKGFRRQIDVPEKKIYPKDLPKGLGGNLLALREEGFFSEPRSLREIVGRLKELAVYYPVTTFSPYLSRLIKQRFLRRFKEKRDGKTIWVYVQN